MIRKRALVGQKDLLVDHEAQLNCAALRDPLDFLAAAAASRVQMNALRAPLTPPPPDTGLVSLDKANVIIDGMTASLGIVPLDYYGFRRTRWGRVVRNNAKKRCGTRQKWLSGLKARIDWSQGPAVESVPGKVSGAWVFRGTRMPVAAVFENLEDGMSIDEIARLYDGLTREQVQSVLEFAARSLEVPALAG